MTQNLFSLQRTGWLAMASVLLAAATTATAQEQSQTEMDALLQQQTQMEDLPSMEQQMMLPPQLRSPAQLQTDMPPLTSDGTDAADLLGTDYSPGAEAMFGEQLFQPGTAQTYGVGINPGYVVAVGDRIALRMWGAYPYQDVQVVDPHGNVFLPNVGPVHIAGVRNSEMNEVIRSAIRQVYRSNVNVYASLEESQPVRVFVTGFVRAPGQYPGVASDSVLGFLLRAGGIDSSRGSYIDIRLLRGDEVRATFNLYDFLLEGRLAPVPVQDGDTIVVSSRHSAVRVGGDVFNSYGFEFTGTQIAAKDLLQLAQPRPGATHVSVVHKVDTRQFSEYHPINDIDGVYLKAGDELSVVTDRHVSTVLVRVDGAIDSSRVLTLPYGSTLRDAMAEVTPKPEANPAALQLFRPAIASRQKQMLEISLRVLEKTAMTSRSLTSEEATLRAREADQVVRFVDRARQVQPRGQVVLAGRETMMDTLLQDGDVLVVPERSNIVMVHGEVTLPTAFTYDSKSTVQDYVDLAGGIVQRKGESRILLLRQDGSFVENKRAKPQPGDEIVVVPAVGAKTLEVARGITQIMFQIAVVAGVALDF